jgi:hypothetical protein
MSLRIAPGVRIRASGSGIRASVGPRVARVHAGSGRTTVSSGFGPSTASSTLSNNRRSAFYTRILEITDQAATVEGGHLHGGTSVGQRRHADGRLRVGAPPGQAAGRRQPPSRRITACISKTSPSRQHRSRHRHHGGCAVSDASTGTTRPRSRPRTPKTLPDGNCYAAMIPTKSSPPSTTH